MADGGERWVRPSARVALRFSILGVGQNWLYVLLIIVVYAVWCREPGILEDRFVTSLEFITVFLVSAAIIYTISWLATRRVAWRVGPEGIAVYRGEELRRSFGWAEILSLQAWPAGFPLSSPPFTEQLQWPEKEGAAWLRGYARERLGNRIAFDRGWWLVARDDVLGGSAVGAAPVVAPRWPGVALFAVVEAALCAFYWASAWPAKPLSTVLVEQVWGIGVILLSFALAGAMVTRRPVAGLRLPLALVPFYLVALVPPVASATVEWEGGWIFGLAGAAAGAAAGTLSGWLFLRWILPEMRITVSVRAIPPPG
jgi:hypothetical protein